MEPIFVLAFGVTITAGVYLMLSRNVLRIILGLLLLSNAINLSLFIAGRMGQMQPPVLGEGGVAAGEMANPLPQALILTAIVISFALTAFFVVLVQRAYRLLGTINTEQMRLAERSGTGERLPQAAADSGKRLGAGDR